MAGPGSSPGCCASHSACRRCRLRSICADRFDITALNGSKSTTLPDTGSSVRPCSASVCDSSGCAAIAAVPSAWIAPCCLNRAAVVNARHFPAPRIRVPICMWMCRCGSPAREVLCRMPTTCICSIGTTSCAPRGPANVTECCPRNRRISAKASCCAASSAAETSGWRAAATDSALGALIVISANSGDPLRTSPGLRGVPIDSPVSGLIQSTHPSYSAADRERWR